MNAVNSQVPNTPFVVAYVPQALLPEIDKLMQQYTACAHERQHEAHEAPVETAPVSAPKATYEDITEADAQALMNPVEVETPAENRSKRRGRIPGRYRFTGKKLNEKALTEKERAVYRLLQARRRGITAHKVQARLGFAQGTVGWALAELKKSGAIEYIPSKLSKARAGGSIVQH